MDAARGHLWIGSQRHGVFRLEIDTGVIGRPRLTPEQIARCARTARAHEALDPDAPDLIWGVRGSGLYLKRGPRVIHRWPAKLPVSAIEVIRDGQTTV